MVVDLDSRLGTEEILNHRWFVMDREVVRQAEELMGLVGSEADSGRGSMMVKEGSEGIKRKRKDDEGGEGGRLGKRRGPTEEVNGGQ